MKRFTKKLTSLITAAVMTSGFISTSVTNVNAATVNLPSVYATNPNGQVGKNKTITIDGDASDWDSSMIVAQGAANDIATSFKGAHENCVLDSYALYAAWDDENLYVGWQMVNTTDTWANPGDGPLSDGGRVLDVPLVIALSVDPSKKMSGKVEGGKWIWNSLQVTYDTPVDHIFMMSGKPGLGTPAMFTAANADGDTSYDAEYCQSFKELGIQYKMATTSIADEIIGLDNPQSPDEIYNGSATWVNMMNSGKGHDRTYDSFYEMSIPLSALGIDKNYIETNGIGVMQLSTRGESALDCLPHDPAMLDNVMGDYAADPSTSHEKDDIDNITVDLAKIGKGGVTPPPVSTPSISSLSADKSSPQYVGTDIEFTTSASGGTGTLNYQYEVNGTVKQAYSTSKTFNWVPTEAGTYTIKVTVKDSNSKTATKSTTFTIEDKPVGAPTVNSFNTNISSPQNVNTSIKLSASASGGSGAIQYMFTATKGGSTTTIQSYSSSSSCTWTPTTAGTYTLKVTAKDSNGKTDTSSKTFVIEDVVDDELILSSYKTNIASPQKVGTSITLSTAATGGIGTKEYRFVAQKDGKTTFAQGYSTKTTAIWKPTEAGTYTLFFKVKDESGKELQKTMKYEIKSTDISITSYKTSVASPQKVGTSITLSTAATGGIGTKEYRFVAQKDGKTTFAQAYSTKTTAIWKPTEAGSYALTFKVKDSTGKEVVKTMKYEIKSTDISITSYKTSVASPQEAGTSITLSTVATGGSGTKQYRFVAQKDGKTTFAQAYSTKTTAIWQPTEAGSYSLTFKVKDSTGKEVVKTMRYEIKSSLTLTTAKTSVASPQVLGKTVTMTVGATGGSGTKQYRFVAQKDGKTTFAQGYSTKTTATWKPTEAGTYTLFFKVKDGTGKEISKAMKYEIKAPLTVTTYKTSVASPQEVGTSITLTAGATGGIGALQYRFAVQKDSKTVYAQGYSTKTTATWTPTEAGNYTIFFKVKDGLGKEVYKYVNYVIKEVEPIKFTSLTTNKLSPVDAGTTVTINAKAVSENAVSYKYWIYEVGGEWKLLKDFTNSTSVTWTPSCGGNYVIWVDAKDTKGNITSKSIEFKVTDKVVTIEEDNEKIKYDGIWPTVAGGGYSGGTKRTTNTQGSVATFKFTGTGMSLIATTSKDRGVAEVTIDGVVYSADNYSSSIKAQAEILKVTGLNSGTHTVTIKYTGIKSGSSSGTKIEIDAIKIFNGNIV